MLKSVKYVSLVFFAFLFLVSSPARAENPIITQPTDFWFEYTEPTLFTARTYQSGQYNSDPQLWLYNSENVLIVTNDDYYGLQSNISIQVQPGRYRLRAGVCCGQPDVWRSNQGWNVQYELGYGAGAVPNTSSTTTTEPPTTTTTEDPTTTTTTTEIPRTTTSTVLPTTSTVPPTTSHPNTTVQSVSPDLVQTTSSTLAPPVVVPVTTTYATTTSTYATTTLPITTTSSTTVAPTTTTLEPVTIPPTVTPEQAAEIATNPEALATATKEEAKEVFAALQVDELTDTQIEQLVAAVQEAPTEVRKAFEQEINIFGGGGFDKYVPVGSKIPVKQRRTLIVIGMAVASAPTRKRRK